jgi:serine/threonine-protein kinase
MNNPKNIGRYEIIDELGHGAMGSVFRAKDPAMDRIVALKTILTANLAGEQGGEFRQRFYREAHAAGALAHPGIVAVFDVGEHEGTPYLVMEYVNGRTLAASMKSGERLSLDRVCEIGQQIADALGYAHRNGVIHRDIKPANILMTSRETYGDERPKITDFGVAKLTAGEITTTGQLLGTPAFMPPEQFTGMAIDGRADLFSLGVILYWMVTGEQPFPGEIESRYSRRAGGCDSEVPGEEPRRPLSNRRGTSAGPGGVANQCKILRDACGDSAGHFGWRQFSSHQLAAEGWPGIGSPVGSSAAQANSTG